MKIFLNALRHSFFRTCIDGVDVTTKTPAEQRTASFCDGESAFTGSERLVDMIRAPEAPPVHFMMASAQDVWYASHYHT